MSNTILPPEIPQPVSFIESNTNLPPVVSSTQNMQTPAQEQTSSVETPPAPSLFEKIMEFLSNLINKIFGSNTMMEEMVSAASAPNKQAQQEQGPALIHEQKLTQLDRIVTELNTSEALLNNGLLSKEEHNTISGQLKNEIDSLEFSPKALELLGVESGERSSPSPTPNAKSSDGQQRW